MISKAMVLEKFNSPLVEKEIRIPPLEDGQILIKMLAAGVCGSDVQMRKGEDPRTPLPLILGHEGVGLVEDINRRRNYINGKEIKVGDKVIWNRGITCGKCFECKILNKPSLCKNRKVYGINRPIADKPYLNGCYSQYVILTDNTDILKIESNIDPALLVPASCSGATIAHGFEMAHINIGDNVLVQGPGPLGVFAVAFAKKLGAKNIIAVGGTKSRLEICKELGATHILNRRNTSKEERLKTIKDITDGRGVEVVVETAGAKGAVEEGLDYLSMDGKFISTGFAQPTGFEKIDFYKQVVRKNVSIHGVWVSDTKHTRQALELIMGDVDKFKKIVTHRFSLSEINDALDFMENKQALKAVITDF